MTAEESEKVLTEWNELHTKALTLLDLGERAAAEAVLVEMARLPFDEARNVAYDKAAACETLVEAFGGAVDTGRRVKPFRSLAELDWEEK